MRTDSQPGSCTLQFVLDLDSVAGLVAGALSLLDAVELSFLPSALGVEFVDESEVFAEELDEELPEEVEAELFL